jgi:DNA polymerase-3 subunit gamma/tau
MLERALSLMLQLFRDIRYSVSPRYELELAISRLCWLTSYVSVNEVKVAIEQAKALLLQGQSIQQENKNLPPVNNAQPKKEGFSHPFFNSGYQQEESNSVTAEQNHFQSEANLSQPVSSVSETPSFQKQEEKLEIPEQKIIQAKPNLTLEELRIEVIKELEIINPFLSSLLVQSTNWNFSDNTIQLEVETPYVKYQLDSTRKDIIDIVNKISGKSVSIIPKLKVAEKTSDIQENLPEVIQILCEDFRGKVVNVTDMKKNTNTHNSQESENMNYEEKHDEEENDEF